MIRSHKSILLALLFAAAFAFYAVEARAISQFPYLEGFENDEDAWTPSDNDPYHDPDADGTPPNGTTEEDWFDARNGWDGVLEEVSNTDAAIHEGVTSSSGDFYGFVQFNDGTGPFGRVGRQPSPGKLNSAWSFQTDVYVNPAAPFHNDGLPDWWWTNAVDDTAGSGYLTETGLTPYTQANDTWNFTTTNGTPVAMGIETGQWVTMEVEYNYHDTKLSADVRVFNREHTVLFGSVHQGTLFLDPDSAVLGGPRYSWFVYNTPNLDVEDQHIYIDNAGVALRVGLGDLNNDGVADFGDIEAFEIALTDPDTYIATWNAPEWEHRGDINNDGFFDFGDIEQYEVLLVGGIPTNAISDGGAGGAAVPEPSSIILAGLGGLGLALGAFRRRRKN